MGAILQHGGHPQPCAGTGRRRKAEVLTAHTGVHIHVDGDRATVVNGLSASWMRLMSRARLTWTAATAGPWCM